MVHYPYYRVGAGDLSLIQCFSNVGTDHRKFMRIIPIYVGITAPFILVVLSANETLFLVIASGHAKITLPIMKGR